MPWFSLHPLTTSSLILLFICLFLKHSPVLVASTSLHHPLLTFSTWLVPIYLPWNSAHSWDLLAPCQYSTGNFLDPAYWYSYLCKRIRPHKNMFKVRLEKNLREYLTSPKWTFISLTYFLSPWPRCLDAYLTIPPQISHRHLILNMNKPDSWSLSLFIIVFNL